MKKRIPSRIDLRGSAAGFEFGKGKAELGESRVKG
jgi:hypothetical protein